MAFFTPSLSPAVVTREIDLTGIVPNVATSTGVFVGNFRWGPVEQPTEVDNEARLVSLFASPDTNNTVDFNSAAYFTKYSQELLVVREVTSAAKNSFYNDSGAWTDAGSRTARLIKNGADWDNTISAADSDTHSFIAKYPGALGNSIQVQVCPYSATDSAFTGWSGNLNLEFDAAPDMSQFAASQIGADSIGVSKVHDEVHVAIIDKEGLFSGQVGGVLETFPFLSLASNAKNADGSTNYIADVLNTQSKYVWLANAANLDSAFNAAGAGTDLVDSADDYSLTGSAQTVQTYNLSGGKNSGALGTSEIATGFDTIKDVDAYQVDFLIAPHNAGSDAQAVTDHVTVINNMTSIAAVTRKDCVVVASPPKGVLTGVDPVGDTVTFANRLTNSSYCFLDNNYLKVFDKYNDQYITIPAAASTAGLMAQTDFTTAPWFSPAGTRRGIYFGVTDILHSPDKGERDTLYRANVNPITNLPGTGITLFGDKTMLRRPSAFDRINVRRLFLTLERAISRAARQVLFEFNDEFTRAEFVNIVEPFLREVKGRRGITDFRVVCDETNNTPEIIDRNEFIATIFIKPARSINFITLNFVATRTGVDFEEVVGLSF
jgi:hypothetical protein